MDKDVIRFQVSMDHVDLVKIFQSKKDLSRDLSNLCIIYFDSRVVDHILQGSTVAVLDEHVEL